MREENGLVFRTTISSLTHPARPRYGSDMPHSRERRQATPSQSLQQYACKRGLRPQARTNRMTRCRRMVHDERESIFDSEAILVSIGHFSADDWQAIKTPAPTQSTSSRLLVHCLSAPCRLCLPPSDSMSTETRPTVIDALPYIDPVNDDYEQYALALIEEKMKTTRAPTLPPLLEMRFRTEFLRAEYEKRERGEEPTKFEPSPTTLATPLGSSIDEWRAAVARARIAYETERQRSMVLEVEKEEAGYLWKAYNEQSAATHAFLQQALEAHRQALEEINHSRQQHQQGTGRELQVLTTQYESLLRKREQLERAIERLQNELAHSA